MKHACPQRLGVGLPYMVTEDSDLPINFYTLRGARAVSCSLLPVSEVPSLREGWQRGRVPQSTACAPISVYTEYVFGTTRNAKTTGNNGKRNNNVQTYAALTLWRLLIATSLRINSQCSLSAVSVESLFAEDGPCFVPLRRLRWDRTANWFAVKSPKCASDNNSRLKFSPFFAKLLATNCCT